MKVLPIKIIKRMTAEKPLYVFLVLILLTNVFTSIKFCAQNASLTLIVSLANNPPVLDPIPDITVHAGNTVTFAPTATDPNLQPLSFSYSGWMNDSVYTTSIDDVTGDASEYYVTVTVSDSTLSDSQEVKVTVCANYSPLRCVNIKPAGVDGMNASNRIFRAYPGIEYNIRTAILGGMYPYQFTWEANKPSWLSMDENTGAILGIAPAAGSFDDITIRITDSKGSSLTAQWSIEVTTENFIFLDAVNGNPSVRNGGTGTGTINNPFKNVKDWYGTSSDDVNNFNDYQNYFVYYRIGTYYIDGYLDVNENMSCDDSKPSVHLAYPGESPKFDMENGKIWAAPIYVDGLEFYNMLGYGIKTSAGNNYYTFRNLYMHGLDPTPGINGQSFINVMADSTQGNYWVWQDCTFDSSSQNGIEINNLNNSLIEDCVFTSFFTNNLDTTAIPAHPIFTNVECRDLTIRHNTIYGNEGKGIFACLAAENSDINKRSANIEICFNNVYDCAEAGISVNAGSNGIQGIYAYRNTVQGNNSISIENAGNNPPEGPYVFENNIIVNPDLQYFAYSSCSADVMNYVNIIDNLVDSTTNNLVDSTGNINPSYSQYIGTYGWQNTNTPPVINPQLPDITANEDTPVSIDLTDYGSDDYDSGAKLNWSISDVDETLFTASIDVNSDILTITPVANMYGIDIITLTLADSIGLTDTIYKNITINPVNDAPVLNPIADITLNEGETVNFNPQATDIDGNIFTYTYSGWMTGSSYVTSYNDAGIHYVTVTVSDGELTDNKNVKITVINVNPTPTAIPQSLTTDEDNALDITLSGTNTLTYSIVIPPANGSLTGTTPNITYTPNPNYNGSDSFIFTTNNGVIDSDTAAVSITVNQVNDLPVLMPIGNQVVEGAMIEFTINASDVDNDTLTYSAGNLPTGADFNPVTRTFTWIPDYNQSSSNFPNILFIVTDSGIPPASCSENISITVGNINHPPVLNSIGNKIVGEGELLEFILTGFDPDGDDLTYTVSNLPSGADFNPITRTFTWIPEYGQSSNYTNILFTVTDNNIPPETDSESITITVGDINRPPVLNPIGNKIINEGDFMELVITGHDKDNNLLTYSSGNLPKGAEFDSTSQKFSWQPKYNQSGNYENILFTVTDNGVPAISSSETITITVGNVNRPPVLKPIGNKKVKQNELLEFSLSGSDVDGDILIYSAVNLPADADFNPSTQTFRWVPGYNQAGIYLNIQFRIDDGQLIVYEEITINVEPLSPKEIQASDCDLDKANGLRRIDGLDLFLVSFAFGSEPGQKNWNPSADINKDGIVSGEDLIILCSNFGKKY